MDRFFFLMKERAHENISAQSHDSHSVARPSVGISLPEGGAELMEVDVGEPFTPRFPSAQLPLSQGTARVGRIV